MSAFMAARWKIEIEINEDKQGLATPKRSMKRFEAQQMLTQLEAPAINTLIWVRRWLQPHSPKIAQFGLKRLVRDMFRMNRLIVFYHYGQILQIILNQVDPLANDLCEDLVALLARAREHVAISLSEI
jgi:hypothetical protein